MALSCRPVGPDGIGLQDPASGLQSGTPIATTRSGCMPKLTLPLPVIRVCTFVYGAEAPVNGLKCWIVCASNSLDLAERFDYVVNTLRVRVQVDVAAGTHPGLCLCLWSGGSGGERPVGLRASQATVVQNRKRNADAVCAPMAPLFAGIQPAVAFSRMAPAVGTAAAGPVSCNVANVR